MKTHTLLYMLLLIVLSLVVCILTFATMSGSVDLVSALGVSLLFSLPSGLLLCLVDYFVISHIRIRSSWRILADVLLTSLIGVALSLCVRFAIDKSDNIIEGTMTFIVWNFIVVLGIEAYLYQRRTMEKETLLARAEKEKLAYQYEALKNQINPHFLFNSLNVLASLAYQDAEKTNLFAKRLSSVYRYLLTTSDKQFVTLDEELRFLESYVYLCHIRFGASVQTRITVVDEQRKRLIVPAALQLLVENALKHNVGTEQRPLIISVSTEQRNIVVSNTLQPRANVPSTGVGLSNIRRQYALHGKQIKQEKTETTFTVTLPLM